MYSSRDARVAVSDEAFAAWAQIDVQYADRAQPMPVLRLDRHGLTVAVGDDAGLSPIGLPRRAQIVHDSVPLCELRLVARSAVRRDARALEVTLQPSRADDHAALWLALRAHQMRLDNTPTDDRPSSSQYHRNPADMAHRPPQDDATRALRRASVVSATPARSVEPAAAAAGEPYTHVWCDATLTLANHDDAWFFLHWLEYHFAEVRARARMGRPAADLRDIHTRVADHEVEVRFCYQSAERDARTCTEASCRWIIDEAARQLDMTVEHWLPSAAPGCASPAGFPRNSLAHGARVF